MNNFLSRDACCAALYHDQKCWPALQILTSPSHSKPAASEPQIPTRPRVRGVWGALLAPAPLLWCLLLPQRLRLGSLSAYLVVNAAAHPYSFSVVGCPCARHPSIIAPRFCNAIADPLDDNASDSRESPNNSLILNLCPPIIIIVAAQTHKLHICIHTYILTYTFHHT
jgi:hypothetical protein